METPDVGGSSRSSKCSLEPNCKALHSCTFLFRSEEQLLALSNVAMHPSLHLIRSFRVVLSRIWIFRTLLNVRPESNIDACVRMQFHGSNPHEQYHIVLFCQRFLTGASSGVLFGTWILGEPCLAGSRFRMRLDGTQTLAGLAAYRPRSLQQHIPKRLAMTSACIVHLPAARAAHKEWTRCKCRHTLWRVPHLR